MEDELEPTEALQERIGQYTLAEFRAFVDGMSVAATSLQDVVNRLDAQLIMMQATAAGQKSGGGDA